ncbi:MAG: hypothetical protein ACLPTZ_00470 [Beijerinckiaceae bacterium]
MIDVTNPIARRDGAEIVKWVDERGGSGLSNLGVLHHQHAQCARRRITYRAVAEGLKHKCGSSFNARCKPLSQDYTDADRALRI